MRTLIVALLAVSLGTAGSVLAQRGMAPEERNALLGYQLTLDRANHLIAAMTSVTQYLASQPDFVARTMRMTVEERRVQMEQEPKIADILKRNNLTARDYLVGLPALRMALMAAQGITAPNVVASPANVAFAKANLGELKPKMDQADGARR